MKRNILTLSLTTFVIWFVGCLEQENPEPSIDDAESIQQALDQDDGGFDSTDEAPMFDEEDEFADRGFDEEDPAVEDEELAYGPGGREGSGIPDDARAITVLVLWGQLRLNTEVARPTVWNGAIAASEGGLIVRRAVRFEGRSDALLPREDRQTVAFRSTTLPHNDGLILTMVHGPADDTGLPPALVASLGEFEDIVVSADNLADGFRAIIPVDRMGNVIVITTVPAHPCPRGVLSGAWRQLRPGVGNFRGRWVGMGGELRGHVRGIYGTNEDGLQVFFGKYISRDGHFRGLLRGIWNEGDFTGRWIDRSGRHLGGLRGHYFVHPDGEAPVDGVFSGQWIEACAGFECGADRPCPGEDEDTELPPELI